MSETSAKPDDNVRQFPREVRRDADVRTVLDNAANVGLTDVVVVGVLPDGRLFVASSSRSMAQVNLLLDEGKMNLLFSNARSI